MDINNNLIKIIDDTKLKKIHFYAFGGIKKTSNWLKTINKPNLTYNGQKFE